MGRNNRTQPLVKCVSSDGKLERDVLIVYKSNRDDVLERKKLTGLQLRLSSSDRKTDEFVANINIDCDLNMPYIRSKISKVENPVGYELDLAEIDDISTPRIVVEVNEIRALNVSEDLIEAKDISHLICITLNDQNTARISSLVNETYCVNENDVEDVIRDILLDIAAFHSWDIEETQFKNLLCRRDISARKSEYARSRGLKSRYKPDGDFGRYFSFASACYDADDKFDIQRFNEIWEDFMKSILIESPELAASRKKDTLADQLKYYSKKKNVSIKRLESMFENLQNGSYILLRTEKEPKKNPRCRRQLMTFFGMSAGWKTGKLKFVKMEEYHDVVRWYPYVSLWKIVKHAA